MGKEIAYRFMRPGEETEVCALVARVFDEFVAADFSRDGVDEFFRYARPEAMVERVGSGHTVLLAEEDDRLLGMVELMGFDQIAMLFVEGRGRGIGKELLTRAVRLCRERAPDLRAIRVHASRYAVPIYRKFGFEPEGPEKTENGITYLPMVLHVEAGG